MITKLNSSHSDFQDNLSKLLAWESVSNSEVAQTVDDIIANIRNTGDKALVDYTNRLHQSI